GDQHLAAGAEARFDLDPRFLQHNLRQADEQADAHADGDEADAMRAAQVFDIGPRNGVDGDENQRGDAAAEDAADGAAHEAFNELLESAAEISAGDETAE